jgi:Protein of unknown function (DUF2846)
MSLKKRTGIWTTLCLAVLCLVGCASGPRYSEINSTFAEPSAGNGRIFIYRTAVIGAAIQPSVKIDDKVVGSAVPQGFFYVDRPAGSYKISASTEVERDLSLTLDAGQVRYVRLAMSIGFVAGHVSPELVENAKGEKDIQALHYTGK